MDVLAGLGGEIVTVYDPPIHYCGLYDCGLYDPERGYTEIAWDLEEPETVDLTSATFNCFRGIQPPGKRIVTRVSGIIGEIGDRVVLGSDGKSVALVIV